MAEPSETEIWLEGETGSMKSASTENTNSNAAVKTCKGILYYSSRLKSQSKSPICAGFTRSHRNLDEVSIELGPVLLKHYSKEKRTTNLFKFKYACVGYSAYSGDPNFNAQETQTEVAGCLGWLALMQRIPITDYYHRKDGYGNGSSPQRGSPSPAPINSTGEGCMHEQIQR